MHEKNLWQNCHPLRLASKAHCSEFTVIIPLKKIAIGRVWSTFIVLKYSGLKTKQKTTFNIHTDEDMLLKAMEDVHCSSLMLPSDDRRGSSVLGVPPLQLHLSKDKNELRHVRGWGNSLSQSVVHLQLTAHTLHLILQQ